MNDQHQPARTEGADQPRQQAPQESEAIALLKGCIKDLGKIIHDMTVAQQAAWIEWRHGRGAEAAMAWIHNGLVGPGLLPEEDEPHGKDAQAYYDANCSDPLPACSCGKPANILWMGQGFCSLGHYKAHRAELDSRAQGDAL